MFRKLHFSPAKNGGYALMELIVALSIFIVLIVASASIYIRFLEQNRRAQETRQLNDQVRVLSERIRNDLNTATRDSSGVSLCHEGSFPRVYSQVSGSNIFFIDPNGSCTVYYRAYDSNSDVFTVVRAENVTIDPVISPLTTPDVTVNELTFTIYENQFVDQQPLVDIFFELERVDSNLLPIAVTLTSAYGRE